MLEPRTMLTTDLALYGDAGASTFAVRLDPTGTDLQIFQDEPETATPTATAPLAGLGQVDLLCNAGTASLTVDYTNGDPLRGVPLTLGVSASTAGQLPNALHLVGLPNANVVMSGNTSFGNSVAVTAGPGGPVADDLIYTYGHLDDYDLFGGGGTATLSLVNYGPFTFDRDLGGGGASVAVSVTGGQTVKFTGTQHLASLNISSLSTVDMLPGGGQVLDTNTLYVGGKLDLANNDLIVNTPSATDLTTIQNQIVAGDEDVSAGTSIGQVTIYSSTAGSAGDTVGFAPAANLSFGSLDGQNIGSSARYTVPGDINLDGMVNIADFGILSSNYGVTTLPTSPPDWYAGDLNFDGSVNGIDFNILSSQYGRTADAAPTAVTLGNALSETLPATLPGTSALPVRWDISWGDGTFNSYGGGTAAYTVNHTFTVSSDGNGGTIISELNGTTTSVATSSLLSLNISGYSVTVDESNGNPLPASGLFADAPAVAVTGGDGADTLVATTTAATFGNSNISGSQIRYNPGTMVTFDNAGSGDVVIALTGNVTLAGDGSTPGPTVLVGAGATAFFPGSITLSSLDIFPGGLARMQQDGTSVLTVGSLNLSSATTHLPGGILDLADNDLIDQADDANNANGSAGSLATVTGLLANGYDYGAWDDLANSGPAPAAIISVVADNDAYPYASLGVASVGMTAGPQPVQPGLFDGVPVVDGDVLVRFTFAGDLGLSGLVNTIDINQIYNSGSCTGWAGGAIDYTSTVDANDYSLAEQNSWTTALALTPAVENQPYTLTLPAAAVEGDLGIDTITGWSVNYGDGSAPVSYAGSTSTVSYTYPSTGAGMYSVAISVTGTIAGQYVTYDLPHQDLVVTPDAPTDLSATESTTGEVDLSWADDEYFPLNYIVTATPSGGGHPEEMNVPGNATWCSMANLSPGVAYTFSVAAVNKLSDGNCAVSGPEVAISAAAPGATLSATGPTSVEEGTAGQTLNLTATGAISSALAITSFGIVWTDGFGNILASETLSGSSGSVAFPVPDSGELVAAITAHDASNNSFSLPLFDVEVSPEPTSTPVATVLSSSDVQVVWVDGSQIADGYIVKRSDSDQKYQNVAVLSGSATSFDDTSVRPGTTVTYKVEAVAGGTGVDSPPSNPAFVPGGVPTIISVTPGPAGTGTVVVAWSYLGQDDSGFEVEAEDTTAGTNFVLMATPGPLTANATTGTCTISDLAGDDVYQFRIRADHTDNTVSAYATQPGTIQMVPDAPEFAAVEYGGATWAEIDWYDFPTSEVISGFRIYISNNRSYGTSPAATALPTATSAIVSGLTANTQYWVDVVAFNTVGNSVDVDNQFTTFAYDLAAPTGLSVVAAGGSTSFTYSSAPGSMVWVQGLLVNDLANSGGSTWYTYFDNGGPNGSSDLEDSVPAGETWRARAVSTTNASWVSQSWSQTAVSASDDTELAPTAVAATAISPTQVQVSWTPDPNAPLGDITGYTVACWLQGGAAPLDYTVADSATAAVVGNLRPSTKYFFAVNAVHLNHRARVRAVFNCVCDNRL